MIKNIVVFGFSAIRSVVVLTIAMFFAVYGSARAQHPGHVHHIGFLDEGSIALRAHLGKLAGYDCGSSVTWKVKMLLLKREEEMESSNDSQRWLLSWSE
jgi:hypothetical protein